jgi:hypothetical protein
LLAILPFVHTLDFLSEYADVFSDLPSSRLQNNTVASQGWYEYEDNTISNHWLNWATSRYDDEILRYGIAMRLNLLKTPATQYRDHGYESRCPFCPEPSPDMKLIMKRHNRIGSAVLKGIKEGRAHVEVWEARRVNQYLAAFADKTGVKSPDLMYDSAYVKRGKKTKVINLCEITSPWPWLNSMETSYNEKVEKYAELRTRLEQEFPEVEVRQHTIVVSPTGCILKQSKRSWRVLRPCPVTGLPRISGILWMSRFGRRMSTINHLSNTS